MKTIAIPTHKLIKFIPSGADGGVIPGRVLGASDPALTRVNDFEFRLDYTAMAAKTVYPATCRLDEELEVVQGSNRLVKFSSHLDIYHSSSSTRPKCIFPSLEDDGLTLWLDPKISASEWRGHACAIPDPFNQVGDHTLSSFINYGRHQLATLFRRNLLHMAIISDQNKLSLPLAPHLKYDPSTAIPCHHNGLLFPVVMSSAISILWLSESEVTKAIEESIPVESPYWKNETPIK